MRAVHIDPMIGTIAQLALLATLADTVGLGVAGWAVGVACGFGGNVALALARVRHGVVLPGPADRVTILRGTLVGGAAALTADSFTRAPHVSALVTLAVVALLLDAVDGAVARHTGTASILGARLDMEVDAFLILVLSVDVARTVGGWVLAIGAARYVFVLAGRVLSWLRGSMPPRYWGKVVAATQGIVLTVAAAGVVPDMRIALAAAFVLLMVSFGVEVRWLWCHRHPAPVVVARRRVDEHARAA